MNYSDLYEILRSSGWLTRGQADDLATIIEAFSADGDKAKALKAVADCVRVWETPR